MRNSLISGSFNASLNIFQCVLCTDASVMLHITAQLCQALQGHTFTQKFTYGMRKINQFILMVCTVATLGTENLLASATDES
jgi:hypothetical protein